MPSLFATENTQEAAHIALARVAVERGVDRYPDGLTYAVPAALADLAPGERVIVPLGKANTPTAGYVVEISDETDTPESGRTKIKSILQRDPSATRLPVGLMSLAKWISTYYGAPIGMTLASMLPAAVKRGTGTVTRIVLDLGDPLPLGEKLPAAQKRVLETLASLPVESRPVEMRKLADLAGVKTTGPVRKLLERGLVEQSRKTAVEAAWVEHARSAFPPFVPESLTAPQQRIVNEISPQLDKGFSIHLLYGVTGSGKTEVYIRLIEQTLATGRIALMLVPEISLTPQTGGRLIGRFPDHRVAVLHSGLTAAQRHQQWQLAADGRAAIVLGARSAIFAPVQDDRLGLIIVDEEHDGSYKQDQAPRYHGRDVAIRRAQLAGCPIVLGSATPSLESWFNATARSESKARYALHRLDDRVPGAKLPKVHVVDFVREQRAHHDKRVHLIGPTMLNALHRTLNAGSQALILLNRRGYANYIACPDHLCGYVMRCDQCDASMIYHLNRKGSGSGGLPGFVRCHHCLSEQKLPATCPDCGKKISTFGLGTQRVEEELLRDFPQLEEGQTLMRVDSDAMHGAKAFHDVLTRFGEGAIRVLLGTQMIAKGLDFPGVQLVGVINADTSINLPDFRAAERTFQLVSQVAGRSGRGVSPGVVIVQTFNPTSPAIRLAAAHDYVGFAQGELKFRAQSGLPPVKRMMRIVVRDDELAKCIAMSRRLADGLTRLSPKGVLVRPPAPCPISRIAGKHRHQVEVIAPTAREIQDLLAAARREEIIKPGAAMAVDVDPIALL
ncbi:MAG TPA: primosomal protein N' [Phycisphaerales bacterium]|nr:primosomal protein N' [Phycisphaerales bacterium]HRQ74721.1 primosomal protein N' [Phycisphaerales bacterium]